MRIQCPSCTAIYEVADALLDPPRTVRCAGCTHDWAAVAMKEPVQAVQSGENPAGENPAGENPAPEEPAPVDTRHVAAEALPDEAPLSAIERLAAAPDEPMAENVSSLPRPRNRLLTIAWAASFAALALMGVAGYARRDLLMEQWPASKLIYTTLGLARMTVEKTAAGQPAH